MIIVIHHKKLKTKSLSTDCLISKKEKNKQEDKKSFTRLILVDENGNRIKPRWIKELEKLSPQKKATCKMKIEEINRKFDIKYNKKIN